MKKLLILASVMFALGGCSESDGGSGTGPDGKVAVSFVLPGIGVETEVGGAAVASDVSAGSVAATRAAGAAVALDEGVTVRILAYEAGSSLAGSASVGYVDEATYVAVKESGAIVLKPCTVTFDANGKVASAPTAGAKPLYLLPGTYDFYAITPAFASSDHKSVSVAHGDDFASSLTEDVTVKFSGAVEQPDPNATGGSPITGSKGAVTLKTLDRKCSKIVFDVDRKSEMSFDKLQIVSVKMTKMTKSPVALKTLIDDIYSGTDTSGKSYIADNSPEFDFPESAFQKNTASGMDPNYPHQWTVESPVLPKKSDKYGIELQVRFGKDAGTTKDATTLKTTEEQIGALDFLPDTRYTFKLKLKGNGIQLILSITPWNTPAADWGSGIGGYPSTYIVVGEWKVTWNWSTGVGGYPVLQGFTVDRWVPNDAWDSDLGTYLSVVFGSALEKWTDHSPWGNGLGEYQSFGFDREKWTTSGNSWSTEFEPESE